MNPRSLRRPLSRFPEDQPMNTTITTLASGCGSASGPRHRLAARAATVLAAAASIAGLGLTSTPAMADDCPNATLRAQNNSTQLPDCRAYEQVTPAFKEGYSPNPNGFTDNGTFAFLSNGNYANNGNGAASSAGGNQYLAIRTGSGWSTKALAPSGPEYYTDVGHPYAFSSDLRSSLWLMRRGDESAYDVSDLYVRRPDDVFSRIGSALDPMAPQRLTLGATVFQASDDLSHVVFSVGQGTDVRVYEYDSTSGTQPQPISIDNAGQPVAPGCAITAGQADGSFYHAISGDGRVIVFIPKDLGSGRCSGTQVFARVNGTTTIAASASQCTRAPSDPGGACTAASGIPIFQGANADGTRVYFTTDRQLVNGDTDATTDLYECDIPSGTPAPVNPTNPCPDLHEVSGAASGADVQGVTRISDDGSRAYFVATGVLASNTAANGAPPAAGDDNLYVWTRGTAHPDGETRFVAKLDPADAGGATGGGLWNPDAAGHMAQATDDGHYLLFATYAPLIDSGPQADTDTARDIYRYDAETGALTRLSTDADGAGGNASGTNARLNVIFDNPSQPVPMYPRTELSEDGSSAVFITTDALVPSDTNGMPDTYLWREGRVSLISSGKPDDDGGIDAEGPMPLVAPQAWITPSGRDIYFTTTAQLTPNDIDTVSDIYDARVDGGFDQSAPSTCSGDACQSLPSAPPPPSNPGSTSSTGQGALPQTTPAFTVGRLTASQLKRMISTGKVSLSVTTNAPGALSAQATATLARRASTVGSAKRVVTKAGTVSLSLTLSEKARAELKSKRKLTVKVLVSQDNVAIARTVSLKLIQAKAAKKKVSHVTSRHAVSKGGRS